MGTVSVFQTASGGRSRLDKPPHYLHRYLLSSTSAISAHRHLDGGLRDVNQPCLCMDTIRHLLHPSPQQALLARQKKGKAKERTQCRTISSILIQASSFKHPNSINRIQKKERKTSTELTGRLQSDANWEEEKQFCLNLSLPHICWSTQIKLLSAGLWGQPLLDQEPHDHQSGLRLWSCFHSNSGIKGLSPNQFQFYHLIFLPKVVARYTLEDEPLSMLLCSVQFRSDFQITKLLANMLIRPALQLLFPLSTRLWLRLCVGWAPWKQWASLRLRSISCVRRCQSRRLSKVSGWASPCPSIFFGTLPFLQATGQTDNATTLGRHILPHHSSYI